MVHSSYTDKKKVQNRLSQAFCVAVLPKSSIVIPFIRFNNLPLDYYNLWTMKKMPSKSINGTLGRQFSDNLHEFMSLVCYAYQCMGLWQLSVSLMVLEVCTSWVKLTSTPNNSLNNQLKTNSLKMVPFHNFELEDWPYQFINNPSYCSEYFWSTTFK